MAEETQILQTMYAEGIRSQPCAICGQAKQRVVHQAGKPDFALCENCQSAFVLEDGGQLRMLYGRINPQYPKVRAFALKQWQRYQDVRAVAQAEQNPDPTPRLPTELEILLNQGAPSDHSQAILDLEAQKSQLFYDRAKKLEPPPRPLRETGELPDLDSLFKE
jgi:hypothetical protein